jgi:hypothetical protein
MASVPPVGRRFFPLDAELELLPGALTPSLHEKLVLLGTHVPFERAAQMFETFSGVHVSEATARREVEQVGAAHVAVQSEAAEQIVLELPLGDGSDRLLLSVDGAFVHLVGGEWAEVKTLAIGEVDVSSRAILYQRE